MRYGSPLAWRLVATLVAVGATAGTVLSAPSPAQAVPGLTIVAEVSATSSATTRAVTAICPSGTTVLSGGGSVVELSAQNQVLLTSMRPVPTPFGIGYQVRATEDDTGYGGAWSLRAFAFCAPRPSGLQYRWAVSESNSQSSRNMLVTCPEGRKVIGTGGAITGGGQHVGLRRVQPLPSLGGVFAGAHEDQNGYGGSWSMAAWAVCADPLPGLERPMAISAVGETFQANSAQALCPWPKRLHGLGGLIINGQGRVFLRSLFPYQTNTAFILGVRDETNTSESWGVRAFAICAY